MSNREDNLVEMVFLCGFSRVGVSAAGSGHDRWKRHSYVSDAVMNLPRYRPECQGV